jgi:hypothetical protein
MSNARGLSLFALLLSMACASAAFAACTDFAASWFGFSLGSTSNYTSTLKPVIKREGTARVIEAVGWESLEGESEGVQFDRIMAFFDRGQFVNIMVIGEVKGQPDAGFEIISKKVAEAVGVQPRFDGKALLYQCEEPIELRVEPTKWNAGVDRVKITLSNDRARAAMRAYVEHYCADPKARNSGDVCK